MIPSTPEFGQVVAGGEPFESSLSADVVVDGQVVLQGHPVAGELVSDGSGKVLTQGTVVFVYSDELGTSILPKDITSWLTPWATWLDVSYRVRLGGFDQSILRGRFKVTGVSDPVSRTIRFGQRTLTVGSAVTLKLADLFSVTARERFITPGGPTDLTSVYAEIGRLTGFGLDKSGVPDAPISRTVTYQEDRLEAVFDLAAIVNGTPYMTPAGLTRLAPLDWDATVGKLTVGSKGTVIRADPDDLSGDNVYNQVVVRSTDGQDTTVLAHREVETGPLRYGGPFGRIPYFASSQFVTDPVAAAAYAEAQLPKVSRLPAVRYTVQCAPDPRWEVWDVCTLDAGDGPMPARVDKVTLPGSGPMSLSVLVDRG